MELVLFLCSSISTSRCELIKGLRCQMLCVKVRKGTGWGVYAKLPTEQTTLRHSRIYTEEQRRK